MMCLYNTHFPLADTDFLGSLLATSEYAVETCVQDSRKAASRKPCRHGAHLTVLDPEVAGDDGGALGLGSLRGSASLLVTLAAGSSVCQAASQVWRSS